MKKVLRGNRSFFFVDGFDETRTKNDGFTCYFGVRTWNLWWFHWNQVFFWWSWGRRPQLHQKNLCFNEYHHRFSSSYLQSNTWIPSFFCPSFIEYRQQNKKNMSAFPLKLFISHWRPNFCPWIPSNFSKYCFNIFPKKNNKILKPLLKPQTICKKSKIPYYGVVNVVKVRDFENHPTRVFLIHVFYRNLKLFMVFIFRLPSMGVLPRGFFFLFRQLLPLKPFSICTKTSDIFWFELSNAYIFTKIMVFWTTIFQFWHIKWRFFWNQKVDY